ncbi:hypothetical protein [Lentzea sp. NBRC 102530]|uniref:hypothetical protein n=1 Tax=Lentzea sp. NBRC 102530 TaxID=3032201 RepID=UPI0024A4DBC1|nr:hypothetical protein [Lentzea sp. NBRC 102530]GLY46575.1 hypothetical protein Lesp01_02310 [Lentzea sp. NBRC 102530]
MAPLGITLTWPTAGAKVEATAATSASRGLTLTIDVLALRTKLGLGGILDGIVAPLLPEELVPLLNPLRKMVVIIGDTEAVANASAAAPLTPPDASAPGVVPPPALDAPPPLSPGTPPVAGVNPPAKSVVPVASARTRPRSLLDFPGVPALLVLTGLGVAAAGAFGMKSFGTFLLGGAPCPSGHPTGVPDLRVEP